MSSSISTYSLHLITWILFTFTNLLQLSLSDPRISEAGLFCGEIPQSSRNANYIPTFVTEMEFLSQQVTARNWGSHSANSTIPFFGLVQCFGDLSHTDCLLCYAASRTRLPRCLPALSARVYLDGCFQRYDKYNFFNESTDSIRDTVNCSRSIVEEGRVMRFKESVRVLIDNVTRTAVINGGFGVGGIDGDGVYVLAQCWKTVSRDGCRACLEKASEGVKKCAPSEEGRGLNAGCYLRYSTKKFYNNEADQIVSKHSGKKNSKHIPIGFI